jgi:hypothetical protein
VTEVESVRLGRCNGVDIQVNSQACRHPRRMTESIRPGRRNVLDIWDNMMRPFEEEEAGMSSQEDR